MRVVVEDYDITNIWELLQIYFNKCTAKKIEKDPDFI